MATSNITVEELSRYKLNETDENKNIAAVVRELLPPPNGGIVLDVGAGLGDIAASAFSDREALLIDILDFPENGCSQHAREQIDFFKLNLRDGKTIDTMLMSHVLQYLDEDMGLLRTKILEMNPQNIIVVWDQLDKFQTDVFQWFRERDIPYNPEIPIRDFPWDRYQLKERIEIEGKIFAPDFDVLAERLGHLIFDARMSQKQCGMFSEWLRNRLSTPSVILPQTVELYARSEK